MITSKRDADKKEEKKDNKETKTTTIYKRKLHFSKHGKERKRQNIEQLQKLENKFKKKIKNG